MYKSTFFQPTSLSKNVILIFTQATRSCGLIENSLINPTYIVQKLAYDDKQWRPKQFNYT